MPKFDYVRVTLSEIVGGEAHVLYNYPAEAPIDRDAVFDGTTAIKEFLNLRECYSLWSRPDGHYFSLVTANPQAQGSSMVLTLRLNNECAQSGRRTVTVLNELKKTLIEGRNLISDAVERAFEAAGLPQEPERLKSWQYEKPLTSAAAPRRPLCYRTYASMTELDAILSFPSQVEYECYERVLVVQATASLRPGSHLDRITAQLKREYTVVTPVGCTASKTVVADGDRLTLTFTKPGFNSRTENISVGAPSPYVKYDGPAIRVKTAAESGMGFVRRVPLNVRSSKGQSVQGYTINVNGRPINTMEPYIEITERDLSPSAKTEIQVASNNYKPLKVIKTPSELVDCEVVELVLEPIEQGITLRLDFGEGRIFNQEITLEKNTPEYSQLHSGNFHGFRAHRLTVAANAEVYNVDMTSPVRPSTAPTAAAAPQRPVFTPNASSPEPEAPRRPVAPVFDRATPDMRDKKKAQKEREKEVEREIATAAPSAPDSDEDVTRPVNRAKTWMWVVIAACALAIIGAIFYVLTDDGKSQPIDAQVIDTEAPTTTETTDVAADASAAPKQAATNADEQADFAYFNDNQKTWNVEDLKSDKGRALIQALSDGDIDGVINNEYFAVAKNANNTIAIAVADMLWGAKGTPNQAANEKAMRKNVKNGVAQIRQIYEDVARAKPKEPNTAPRPVK